MESTTRAGTAVGRSAPYRGRLLPRRRSEADADGHGHADGLATALGWFSMGLGVMEVVAPEWVARLIGLEEPEERTVQVVRAMGVREIAAGVGILSKLPRQPGWLWARVAGDVLDLSLLARAGAADGTRKQRTALATLAVLGVTALDIITAARQDGEAEVEAEPEPTGIHVQRSITVNRSRDDVYDFWRDFENLPRFMKHLESVRVTATGRSRWKAKAPAGMTVEWDAETTADEPGRRIAWRSLPGAQVDNLGEVRFEDAPGGRGTEIHVDLRYDPPGGKASAALARLFRREPKQQLFDDLRAFKQVMETGEVMISDATVEGGPHPARPPEQSKEGR